MCGPERAGAAAEAQPRPLGARLQPGARCGRGTAAGVETGLVALPHLPAGTKARRGRETPRALSRPRRPSQGASRAASKLSAFSSAPLVSDRWGSHFLRRSRPSFSSLLDGSDTNSSSDFYPFWMTESRLSIFINGTCIYGSCQTLKFLICSTKKNRGFWFLTFFHQNFLLKGEHSFVIVG